MAKNQMTLDTSGLEAALSRLLATVGPERARQVVEENLEKVGERISNDTIEAVQAGNLPAGGVYSTGDTEAAVVKNPQVTWDGGVASIPVGFDFNKPGAGGWLISGTPKMRPDAALRKIYKGKKYMEDRKAEIAEAVWNEILKEEGH